MDHINTKVHFWYGEVDRSASVAMGQYLSSTVPNSQMTVIPDAGHLWVLVHLNEVLEDIKQRMMKLR